MDVSAIAGSTDYQCYLNSEEYLSSGGEQLPPVTGAGTGQNSGDNPTATTAFVATYLDTEIDHQLVVQLADTRHVTVTQADLAAARTTLTNQISGVMQEVTQTAQGENPHFTCSATGQPISGDTVLASMPASFVDQQVQFVATVTALEEDLAGVGSSPADLERYFEAHSSDVRHCVLHGRHIPERRRRQRRGSAGGVRDPLLTSGVPVAARRSTGMHGAVGHRGGVALEREAREPCDRDPLAAHRRQRDLAVAADHLEVSDALRQGEGVGRRRRSNKPDPARRRPRCARSSATRRSASTPGTASGRRTRPWSSSPSRPRPLTC